MNTARKYIAGFGTQTAAIVAGGGPPVSAVTEEYDGSSWTAVNSMRTARGGLGGAGTAEAGLVFGGLPSYTTESESWDGTNWSTSPSLATGRYHVGGAGTQTSTLAFGGRGPGFLVATEEFTGETATETASSIDFD